MATREQLEIALVNADKAGDVEAARALANELVKMRAAPTEPEGPGMMQQLGRQLGLTARAPLNAALGIPAMIGDLVTGGRSTPAVKTVLDAVFPSPETATERVVQNVAGAMPLGAGLAKLTGTAATMLPQVLSAGGGAAGSGSAREAGFGPAGQLAAGVAAGVFAPSVATAGVEGGKAALRGAKALADPFTEQGRRNIVARTMQSQAKDPRAAAEAARTAPEFVPGSIPNTAEASGDVGLAALQKAVRNQRPTAFAEHAAAQDAARQEFLRRGFGNQTDITSAQAARSAETAPLRESALAAANRGPMPLESGELLAAIGRIKNAPGKRASEIVQKTLTALEQKIASLSDENGVIDARDLYTIRKEMGTTIQQFSKETANWDKRLTAGLETSIKGHIDNAIIKAGGTEWKDYLRKYSDATTKINAQELGQEITSKALNPTTERLSPAMFARQMANRAEDVAGMGARGSDVLSRVNMDLKRSVAPDNVMRAPGSDTLQNLVGSNVLQRMTGVGGSGPVGKLAGGLLGKVYGPLETQTQDLLVRGMLDKNLGSSLLVQQMAQNPNLRDELLRRMLGIPGAGLLGASVAQ